MRIHKEDSKKGYKIACIEEREGRIDKVEYAGRYSAKDPVLKESNF